MKYNPICRWVALPLAASVSWANVSAQTTGNSEDEEIFELSPFTVTSEGDDGYRATSTTAGSRLNSQLKDVAASVTVLTEAFMDDLGATDIESALSMVAGVETELTTDQNGGGLKQGNLGGDFGDPNSRNDNIRVRGLGSATISADYMKVLGPVDRYNIERTEFLRGPNAILFGLGSPAGIVNYASKKANLNKDINKFSFVLDNFGTRRGTIDLSRVLIEDKLALRVNGLFEDSRYMFKTAGNTDNRLYLAAAYKPFKNTRIDLNYENAKTAGNRPNYRLPQDNVSGWKELWEQAHEKYSGDELQQHLDDNFYWDASWATIEHKGGNPGAIAPSLDYTQERRFSDETYQPKLRDQLDGRERAVSAYISGTNGWNMPDSGFFSASGTLSATGADGNTRNPFGRTRFFRSGDPQEDVDTGFIDKQVTDESIFPYLDYELGTLPGNDRSIQNTRSYAALEQKVTEDLYISLSYQKEDNHTRQIFMPLAQTQQISIDVNRYLPGALPNPSSYTGPKTGGIDYDGAVELADSNPDDTITFDERDRVLNPNFLRPFFHGRAIGGDWLTESESFLAQSNYDFDFAEKSDKLGFLGFHRLTGFYSKNSSQTKHNKFTNTAEWKAGVTAHNDDRPNGTRRIFWPIYYIGDAIEPGKPLNINMPDSSIMVSEETDLPLYHFNQVSGTRGSWSLSDETIRILPTITTGSSELTSQDTSGFGGSLQSFFWNRRIVATYGLRTDSVQKHVAYHRQDLRASGLPGLGTGLPVLRTAMRQAGEFQTLDGYSGDFSDFILSPETIYDASGAPVMLSDYDENGVAIPGTERPFVMDGWQLSNDQSETLATKSLVFHATPWLRFFYNQSENFDLTNPRTNMFGDAIPSQGGNTEEYGFGMSLLENKLDLKFNVYETAQVFEGASDAAILTRKIPAFENTLRRMLGRIDQRSENGQDTGGYNWESWSVPVGRNPDGSIRYDNTMNRTITQVDELDENEVPTGNLVDQVNEYGAFVYAYDGDFIPAGGNTTKATQSSVSKGWEFTGTYNPNKNLRIKFSFSKLENTLSNVHRESLDWLAERTNYYRQFIDKGYHESGYNDDTIYLREVPVPENPDAPRPALGTYEVYSDYVPTGNERLYTRDAGTYATQEEAAIGNGDTNGTLLISQFYQNFGSDLITELQSEGASNAGVQKYSGLLTTAYSFREGALNGFTFGTNLRWNSGKLLGYPQKIRELSEYPDEFIAPDLNKNGVIDNGELNFPKDDLNRAIYSDQFVTGGVMLSYRGKLSGDRVNWRVQLNVDNLFKQGDDLRPIRINGDETYIYGINQPTTYKLTNSFEF